MRFFQVVLSGAALLAAAWALEFNDVPTKIEPGKTYTITYSPKDNTPTTIKLRKGDSANLDTIATLTTSATGGSFQWTVDASLPNAKDYALEIDQEGVEPNYSGNNIELTGSDAQPSSSGSATPSATETSTAKETSTKVSTTVKTTTLLTTTAVSAGVSSTPGSNSTIASATLSRTGSSTPTASTTGGGSSPPETTGAASMLGSSPMALIFGAVAAMAYLN